MLAFDKMKEIEVSEFHTSNAEATYLATYGGKYFEINAVVAGLLEIAKQASTIDDAVARYVEAGGGTIPRTTFGNSSIGVWNCSIRPNNRSGRSFSVSI